MIGKLSSRDKGVEEGTGAPPVLRGHSLLMGIELCVAGAVVTWLEPAWRSSTSANHRVIDSWALSASRSLPSYSSASSFSAWVNKHCEGLVAQLAASRRGHSVVLSSLSEKDQLAA